MMSREWVKDTREAWARAANEALRQERDGLIERIKERIAGIYRELQALQWQLRNTLTHTFNEDTRTMRDLHVSILMTRTHVSLLSI